jgi:4-carboxymuconolactone decarboxylase
MPEELDEPRIAPVDGEFEGMLSLNIFRTLAHHPKLMDRFSRFGGFLLYRGLLPARERELVILRVGFRCGSVYEFGQHTVIGHAAGLTEDEVRRLAIDEVAGWSDADRDLVLVADELCAHDCVRGETWSRLAVRWSESELLELLVVAGFYRLVSGLLNTVGIQLEPGTPGWPNAAASGPAPGRLTS